MSALINISTSTIGGEAMQTVNARDLHRFLESGQEFRHWIKARIDQYGFVENRDFTTAENFIRGGKAADYYLTIDMAKELSMVERTAKGKMARQYFIECERIAKASTVPQVPQTFAQALRLAAELEEQKLQLEQQITRDAPKVQFADAVRQMEGTCQIGHFAKTLKHGRNKLFARMRRDKVLMENNLPYQDYINRGWFTVIENEPYERSDGSKHPTFTTLLTGKGQVALSRRYPVGTDLDSDLRANRRAA